MNRKRICKACQKVFYGHRAQYCSLECRAKDHTRNCHLCGESFVATKSTKMYCGLECQQKAIKLRKLKLLENPYKARSYDHSFNPCEIDSFFEDENERRKNRKRL